MQQSDIIEYENDSSDDEDTGMPSESGSSGSPARGDDTSTNNELGMLKKNVNECCCRSNKQACTSMQDNSSIVFVIVRKNVH